VYLASFGGIERHPKHILQVLWGIEKHPPACISCKFCGGLKNTHLHAYLASSGGIEKHPPTYLARFGGLKDTPPTFVAR